MLLQVKILQINTFFAELRDLFNKHLDSQSSHLFLVKKGKETKQTRTNNLIKCTSFGSSSAFYWQP